MFTTNFPNLSADSIAQIIDANPVPSVIVDARSSEYLVICANQALQETTGRASDEIVGLSIFNLFPESIREGPDSSLDHPGRLILDEVVTTRLAVTLHNYHCSNTMIIKFACNDQYWTTTHAPIFNELGNVDMVLISYAHTSNKSILQKEETQDLKIIKFQLDQVHSLLMQAPMAIAICMGPDLRTNVVNEAFCVYAGTDRKELLGQPLHLGLPQSVNSGCLELMASVLETGEIRTSRGVMISVIIDGVPDQKFFNFEFSPFKDDVDAVIGVFCVGIDVTAETKNKISVEQSEAKFRFLSECLPQQVWTADENGNTDFINNCLQTYLSWEINDMNQPDWKAGGKNWMKYIHPDDFQRASSAWNWADLTGRVLSTEFRLLRRDGIYRWHQGTGIPFKSGGKIVKWLGTNTDIEDIKQLEIRKDEFIGIASHELKTPITSLKGYMQLLENNLSGPNAELYVKRGLSQIYRMEKLISDLLDVSKMSADSMTYNRTGFDFQELLEETIGALRLTGYSHELQIKQNTTTTIYADRTRLEQVIINLVTNAMKYSPQSDKVIIESTVKNNTLTVSIQDFGIGIHDSHRNRLFERFYRIDKTAVFFAGLGLGLYLSSKIISGHQGNCGYVSSPGAGSTFYFNLPLYPEQVE